MNRKLITLHPELQLLDITLIPIIETSMGCWYNGSGVSACGMKQPIGVIVRSPSVEKVITITGEELSLSQFFELHPEVQNTLDKANLSFPRIQFDALL